MEMKSRAVKLFCAIAESGSLLAASNKLNLSSSAASRMLSQLEDRLGVKLFERGNKQLVLSEEGNNFYRVAHEAMKAWKVLEDYSAHQKAKRRLLRTAVMARHCSDVTDGHVDAGSYRGSSCGRNFLDAGCASNGQKKRRRSHYGPFSCYQCE